MTTLIYERVAGDTGPNIERVLSGTGTLSGVASIAAYLHRKRMTPVPLVSTVLSAATRTITTNIGAWLPTALPGDWKIKYRITWTNAGKQTWEPGRPDVIRVAKNPAL